MGKAVVFDGDSHPSPPVAFRVKCRNQRNRLQCYVALLMAGRDLLGHTRYLGVVQPDSWTDEDVPRPMRIGAEVGMDAAGLNHESVSIISRFPSRTVVPRSAIAAAEAMGDLSGR